MYRAFLGYTELLLRIFILVRSRSSSLPRKGVASCTPKLIHQTMLNFNIPTEITVFIDNSIPSACIHFIIVSTVFVATQDTDYKISRERSIIVISPFLINLPPSPTGTPPQRGI